MIGRVWALALNTYREAVRQKVLYVLVFFAVSLILLSLFLGQLSLGADTKIIKDMGLASIMLFGSLLSIFIGIGLVFKEVERRTIYTILSKPVGRGEFVLGKFFGLALTVGVVVASMTLLLFLVLSLYREPLDPNLVKAVLLIYAEQTVLVAVALLFSSYSSSFMSALFCLSFLLVGHLTDDLNEVVGQALGPLVRESSGWRLAALEGLRALIRGLTLFNLDHFAINNEVVHGVHVPWGRVGAGVSYALFWWVLILSGAAFLFRRKDLQ